MQAVAWAIAICRPRYNGDSRRSTPAGGPALCRWSFFGPEMRLSTTASRFDSSISWLAAIGNEAALTLFDDFGPDTIYARNHELASTLRAALDDGACVPADLPESNQSTIVTIPLGDVELSRVVSALSEQGIIVAARDGNLRISIHFYNHEDDIHRLATTLGAAVRAS